MTLNNGLKNRHMITNKFLITIIFFLAYNMAKSQDTISKYYNSKWKFLAIKKTNLEEHIDISNSKNKDTIIKILNNLQYDLFYEFDKKKVDQSYYYQYMKQFYQWNDRSSIDFELSKEGALNKIINLKSKLLKGQSLNIGDYTTIKKYYLIKNTYYCFNNFWYDTTMPFIVFSDFFIDEHLFRQYIDIDNIRNLPNFNYAFKFMGHNDFGLVKEIDSNTAKKILEKYIDNYVPDIDMEITLLFSLLQNVIDENIYLIIILSP